MISTLRDWTPVLLVREIQFVNLQYGEVKDDLLWAKRTLDVNIEQLPNIDLFNDLDDLAAVMSSMDLVISTDNINSHLAGALGATLWYLAPKHWFLLCGQDFAPFYPRAEFFELNQDTYHKVATNLDLIRNNL